MCAEETQIYSHWNGESKCKIQKAMALGDNIGNEIDKSSNNEDEINDSLQNYISCISKILELPKEQNLDLVVELTENVCKWIT